MRTTNALISLAWVKPNQLGTIPPIYRINCKSPVEACEFRKSTRNLVETSNLMFTYKDLLPNINYTFTVCAHNSMTISYGVQGGPRFKCDDLETLTKEGCRFFLLGYMF